MHRLRSLLVSLVAFSVLASGCRKTQTALPSSDNQSVTSLAENARSTVDSAPKVVMDNQVIADDSNAEQQTSMDNPTQAVAVAASAPPIDIDIQNLDPRLQQSLKDFHTQSNKIARSTMAADISKLADAGVPKPQVASALGYLFRDENSVEVKRDILNELGTLEDPS